MAKSVDDLIEFLLEEIALSGSRGESNSDQQVDRGARRQKRCFYVFIILPRTTFLARL